MKFSFQNLTKSASKDQPVSLMKRDTSRIFTVPEDAELDATHYTSAQAPPLSLPIKESEPPAKYQHPLTPSVCSTPLKDVNRVLHDFAVSICAATEETKEVANTDDIPDVVKEALRCKRLNKLRTVTPKNELGDRSLSLGDLERHTNKIPLRTYSLGLPKLNGFMAADAESPKRKLKHRRLYQTITDPLFPVFRSDGLPVSQSLYDDYVESHYRELSKLPCEPVVKLEKVRLRYNFCVVYFILNILT